MGLLANENSPGLAITAIRLRGHEVAWIREDSPGISDHAVLSRVTLLKHWRCDMCIENKPPSDLKPQRGEMCNMRLIGGSLS